MQPFMYLNIRLGFLCDFQERLTFGRRPEAVADMIPEGEIILTINVYYPAIIEKVSFPPSGCQKPSKSDSPLSGSIFLNVILYVTDIFLPLPLSSTMSDPT